MSMSCAVVLTFESHFAFTTSAKGFSVCFTVLFLAALALSFISSFFLSARSLLNISVETQTFLTSNVEKKFLLCMFADNTVLQKFDESLESVLQLQTSSQNGTRIHLIRKIRERNAQACIYEYKF